MLAVSDKASVSRAMLAVSDKASVSRAMLAVLSLSLLVSPSLCWYPRVLTPQGPIVGRTEVSRAGRRFFMFDGIPYAKPPTGQRRFLPPEPLEPWPDDFDANRAQIVCIQTNLGHQMGTEDCLVLNVYTPKLTSSGTPLSVIVFFHGGNFDAWTSSRLIAGGPEFFMDEDIVLVSMNYRLGIMGFMSTEDKAATGNYGMLDQRLALQWVQKNIASFGGNPQSVTLFGISAGSASIHLHMASPLSKGLFHRVVMQSGTAFSGFCRGHTQKKTVEEIARILDCPDESSFEMVKCMRDKDAEDIIKAVDQWKDSHTEKGERFLELPHPWTPREDVEADNPFLPKHLYDVFHSGEYSQVPSIIGNSKDEIIYSEEFPLFIREQYERVKSDWPKVCEIILNDLNPAPLSPKLLQDICDLLQQRYLLHFDGVNMENVTKLFNYGGILHGVYKALELMIQHDHPVYYYSMDHYREDQSILQVFSFAFTKAKGALHANDLIYLFTFPMIRLDDKETKVSRNYIAFLTSFANTGVPTFPEQDIQWLPTNSPDFQHLRLDDNLYIAKKDTDEDYIFWEEIFGMLRNSQNQNKDEL